MLVKDIAEYTVYNERDLKWCRLRGYDVEIGDTIEVPIDLLNRGARARVYAKCDVCGDIKKVAYSSYTQNIANQGFYCCPKCKYVKEKATNLKRYGVECSLLDKEIREKGVCTSMERYGTAVPAASAECQRRLEEANLKKYGVKRPLSLKEVQDKARKTNLAKYGSEFVGGSAEIQAKIKKTNIARYGCANVMGNRDICDKAVAKKLANMNGAYTYTSRQQRHIYEVYGGELNVHIGGYFVDILLDDNIFFEYDGGGHDMAVKCGWCSQEEFDRREQNRTRYLKSAGYKEFRMISKFDRVPSDDILISLFEYAHLQFSKNFTSVIYNIDNNTILVK